MPDCGVDGLTFKKPSLCKPQFALDCDLHTIVERFMKTGQLPQSSNRQPIEGDFTHVGDFQQIQDQCVAVRQQFEQLPLEVRNQFNNDPVAWFEQMFKDKSPSNTVPSNTLPSNTVPSNTVPSNTVPSNTLPSNTPPSNTVPSNTPPSNTVPSNTVPSNE